MLVPEIEFVATSLVDHADVMLTPVHSHARHQCVQRRAPRHRLTRHAASANTPGANRSTHEPKFENAARVSALSVAATVSADGVRAGLALHALALLLPAATTTTTPAPTAASTAASIAADAPPPSDMLITFFVFCTVSRHATPRA